MSWIGADARRTAAAGVAGAAVEADQVSNATYKVSFAAVERRVPSDCGSSWTRLRGKASSAYPRAVLVLQIEGGVEQEGPLDAGMSTCHSES